MSITGILALYMKDIINNRKNEWFIGRLEYRSPGQVQYDRVIMPSKYMRYIL